LLRTFAHDDPDPAKVHLLMLSVAEWFSSLAENVQAFMSALRAIDFPGGMLTGYLIASSRCAPRSGCG
jgi:hypothetical protein